MYLVALVDDTIHQKQIKDAGKANQLVAKAKENYYKTFGVYPTISWKVIQSDSITDAFRAGDELKASMGI